MRKVNLILAESALELVPRSLWTHVQIVRDSQRRRLLPGQLLLDRSFHHRAMMNLEDSFKRGRPDLVHVSLMEAVDSPLYERRGVKVYVHTRNDEILTLADNVRLPKHYTRFEGVIRKLLFNRRADRDGLIDYSRGSVGDLLERLGTVDAVGLTKMGEPSNYGEIAAKLLESNQPCLIVGGFAKGHFSAQTKAALARVYSAAPESLEAHVVISRMIYELEKLKMAED